MAFSVVSPDHHAKDSEGLTKVYDVFIPRGPRTAEMAEHRRRPGYCEQVLMVRHDYVTGHREQIRLGAVMHDTGGLTANWWAMGYYPGWLNPADIPSELIMAENPVESARGFATRRYAIEHMLRRTGWWPQR